jgi:hypothetical protein
MWPLPGYNSIEWTLWSSTLLPRGPSVGGCWSCGGRVWWSSGLLGAILPFFSETPLLRFSEYDSMP